MLENLLYYVGLGPKARARTQFLIELDNVEESADNGDISGTYSHVNQARHYMERWGFKLDVDLEEVRKTAYQNRAGQALVQLEKGFPREKEDDCPLEFLTRHYIDRVPTFSRWFANLEIFIGDLTQDGNRQSLADYMSKEDADRLRKALYDKIIETCLEIDPTTNLTGWEVRNLHVAKRLVSKLGMEIPQDEIDKYHERWYKEKIKDGLSLVKQYLQRENSRLVKGRLAHLKTDIRKLKELDFEFEVPEEFEEIKRQVENYKGE